MSEEKFLTVRDVSILLGVSERKVMDLAEGGTLPAYKIGGVYLRFKKEQVLEFKKASHLSSGIGTHPEYSLKDRVGDFLYFNDFYILAFLLITLLLVFIFQGY